MAVDLSVIIVNWKSKDFLMTCLATLRQWTRDVRYQIIVVDNASYDGCGEMLEKDFPEVLFIQSKENLGFAKANNLGVASAVGRNLVFLNPDTELFENTLGVLCARLEALPKAGVVGCKLLNSDRTLQTSCVQSFPTILNQFLDSDILRGLFPKSALWGTSVFLARDRRPVAVDAVSGACLMVKRNVFEVINGFTKEYFMYGEDIDFCHKVQSAGYRVFHLPEIAMLHHGSTSAQHARSNFSNVMMRQSICKFLRLRRGWLSACSYRIAMATAAIIRLILICLLSLGRVRRIRHPASATKWYSILRWSVGIEGWAKG